MSCFSLASDVSVAVPLTCNPALEISHILAPLILKNIHPSLSGLSILTLSLVVFFECVISRLPNKFTLESLIDISGVLPIVPTIILMLRTVSPFLMSKS